MHSIFFRNKGASSSYSDVNHYVIIEKLLDYTVTCTPIARQRVGKQVPVKTDSW
jgi:hypothetical protein